MKTMEDGVVREMTDAEYAAYLADEAEAARIEALREPTELEQLRADLDFVMAMEGWL